MKRSQIPYILSLLCLASSTPSCSRATAVQSLLNSSLKSNAVCTSNSGSKAVVKNYGEYKTVGLSASVDTLRSLSGHVPPAILHSQKITSLDAEQNLSFSVSMPLNNEDQLDRFLQDLNDPESTQFHQYLSPDEFLEKYGPTEDQVMQTKSLLVANGMDITRVDPHRRVIHASGKIKTINSFFNTEINEYYDLQKNDRFFAPAYEVQIPKALAIQSIHGLENRYRAHHYHRTKPSITDSARNYPRSAASTAKGLAPTMIQKAYNFPTQLNGSGQVLAVFELEAYDLADITFYENYYNLNQVPLQNVLVGGATGIVQDTNAQVEVSLDIELMAALAPGAAKIMIYEGPNNDEGLLDTYRRIASDNLAKVISTSWGADEGSSTSSFLQSENSIFKQMAAQGQTLVAAAGDSGAYDNATSQGVTTPTLSVDDPASQPYVLGVGGTTLTVNLDGSYKSESSWNNGSAATGAGGGGISSVWPIPIWQKSAITKASKGSTTMRNVPDVSLNANQNTGYAIYSSGQWIEEGGTSCAAPLWAAFLGLVNQQIALNKLGTLGFANTLLYSIGTGSSYSTNFHDINDGTTNLYYPTVPGYDVATGWGSLVGGALLPNLAPIPVPVAKPTTNSSHPCP
jgi:kumamolisin